MAQQGDDYSLDETGLWVEDVGPWATDKLKIVTDYIQASSAARRRYLGSGASYIDVFCGPGRSKIRGPASIALPQIVKHLNPFGLHFAFLDPHNLGSLSFDLFENLAKLKRIDIIVHVSLSDLQRNADRYTSAAHDEFDRFVPGWRDRIQMDTNQFALRAAIIEYWTEKVMSLGLPRAEHCELFKGPSNQRLYWLIFLSKHPLAHSLWSKISSAAKSPEFLF